MANIATFKVLVPAMNVGAAANGAPTPDPQPIYVGHAADMPQMGARQIGQALVTGGVEAGGAIRGCTYITPHFQIPGFGEISYH